MRQNKRSKLLVNFLTGFALVIVSSPAISRAQTTSCPAGYQASQTTTDSSGRRHIVSCVDAQTGSYWFAGKIADSGGQVYNVRAYGAQTNGRGDDSAAVQAALDAMPGCTVQGHHYDHCGKVFFPPGRYRFDSPVSIRSPYVWLQGAGPVATTIDYYGPSGCAIEWTASALNNGNDDAGGLYELEIDGTHAGAGTCGLQLSDITGIHFRGAVSNFARTASSGIVLKDVNQFIERLDIVASLKSNARGVSFIGNGKHGDIGYSRFAILESELAGQVGIYSDNARVYYSHIRFICNMEYTATGISLNNSSHWFFNTVTGRIEETTGSGGIGFHEDSTSSWGSMGNLSNGSPNSITGTWLMAAGQPIGQSRGLIIATQNLKNATSTVSVPPPCMQMYGQYWNGIASAQDSWAMCVGILPGTNGASYLAFNHDGSTGGYQGTGFVRVPQLEVRSPRGTGGVAIESPSGLSSESQLTLPSRSGAVALTGGPGAYSKAPTCSPSTEGEFFSFTDSTVNTWGAAVTGGGSDHVLGYCDGTIWTVAAR